jgi:drug/metabolite transporter (DMT)-like permease
LTHKASGREIGLIVLSASMFATVNLFIKWIGTSMDGGAIALMRGVGACLFLGVIFAFSKSKRGPIDKADRKTLIIAGIAQTLNWLLYIYAVQITDVSVAVVALFTYPLLTAIAEPFVFKLKHRPIELFAGGMVLLGVILIVPEFSLSSKVTLGVLLGLGAGAALTVRNIIGRAVVDRVGSVRFNLILCAISTLIYVPIGTTTGSDWPANGLLLAAAMGIFGTALPQVIFFHSLKRIPATLASIIVSMQPVFAVILAITVLGERPSLQTLLGGLTIVGSVVLVSLWKKPEPAKA